MGNKSISMREIRKLAVDNPADSLQRCMNTQLSSGENSCLPGNDAEVIISALAKATFVRGSIDKEGLTVNEAVRKLGARMRIYSGSRG